MPFQIIRNDITKVKADAIVNTANPKPRIGRGTDSAIYAAAGKERLLARRKEIGELAPGQAASTDAFDLDAKYILHTVGPVWVDGSHGEGEILRSCYAESLALADKLRCRSVAFPLIASGAYGFPKDEALNIALSEIGRFLLTHEMKILLVVFDRKALELSENLMGSVEQYIDDHTARSLREQEYGSTDMEMIRRRGQMQTERLPSSWNDGPSIAASSGIGPLPPAPGMTLEEVLQKGGKSFQQRLFELIDERKLDDVTVYKRANISRKVFSSIRCKPDYRPRKRTAVAFGIALGLDMPTMADLLSRAGFALSPSDTFDLIISYFITNRVYDVDKINVVLFNYGLPLLGC